MRKNEKGISAIQIIILVVIIILVIIFSKNLFTGNNIEDRVLTKDNFYQTIEEYSNSKKNSDNVSYAVYFIQFNLNADDEDPYSSMYGKTLKELIKEGKSLMERDNITPKEFRKNIENEFM